MSETTKTNESMSPGEARAYLLGLEKRNTRLSRHESEMVIAIGLGAFRALDGFLEKSARDTKNMRNLDETFQALNEQVQNLAEERNKIYEAMKADEAARSAKPRGFFRRLSGK